MSATMRWTVSPDFPEPSIPDPTEVELLSAMLVTNPDLGYDLDTYLAVRRNLSVRRAIAEATIRPRLRVHHFQIDFDDPTLRTLRELTPEYFDDKHPELRPEHFPVTRRGLQQVKVIEIFPDCCMSLRGQHRLIKALRFRHPCLVSSTVTCNVLRGVDYPVVAQCGQVVAHDTFKELIPTLYQLPQARKLEANRPNIRLSQRCSILAEAA